MMNCRVRKDFRILAPYFVAALVVHFLAWGYAMNVTGGYWPLVLILNYMIQMIFITLIAVLPFGIEFDHNTWERLFSLPISRRRIWWEKTLLVTLLCIILCGVYLFYFPVGYIAEFRNESQQMNRGDLASVYSLFFYLVLLPIFMGPSIALHCRQTHIAFWRTLIYSLGTLIVLFILLACIEELPYFRKVREFIEWIHDSFLVEPFYGRFGLYTPLIVCAVPWCILAYVLARRRFERMEV